jgi:hypothetical protein
MPGVFLKIQYSVWTLAIGLSLTIILMFIFYSGDRKIRPDQDDTFLLNELILDDSNRSLNSNDMENSLPTAVDQLAESEIFLEKKLNNSGRLPNKEIYRKNILEMDSREIIHQMQYEKRVIKKELENVFESLETN